MRKHYFTSRVYWEILTCLFIIWRYIIFCYITLLLQTYSQCIHYIRIILYSLMLHFYCRHTGNSFVVLTLCYLILHFYCRIACWSFSYYINNIIYYCYYNYWTRPTWSLKLLARKLVTCYHPIQNLSSLRLYRTEDSEQTHRTAVLTAALSVFKTWCLA